MDFKNGKELLALCMDQNISISEAMKQREVSMTDMSLEEINKKMKKALKIMQDSVKQPLTDPVRSIGGLIGGEAARLEQRRVSGKSICGNVLGRSIIYAMGVMEVNTSMGLIVAAPTAGSSGIVPGLLLALQEEYHLTDELMLNGLFTASAIGYLAMRNASVSGAVAGCQAEVGVASAMAAAAATEIMGGSPPQCMDAASTAIMNLLGLVCDPIAGLVECPCQSRNAMGVSNALTCAEIALSGIRQLIPLDEILDAMFSIGRGMPRELRETAQGGCAATATGCGKTCEMFGSCH